MPLPLSSAMQRVCAKFEMYFNLIIQENRSPQSPGEGLMARPSTFSTALAKPRSKVLFSTLLTSVLRMRATIFVWPRMTILQPLSRPSKSTSCVSCETLKHSFSQFSDKCFLCSWARGVSPQTRAACSARIHNQAGVSH